MLHTDPAGPTTKSGEWPSPPAKSEVTDMLASADASKSSPETDLNTPADSRPGLAEPLSQTSQSLVPPYWQRRRTTSALSVLSITGQSLPITLEDNTEYVEGDIQSPLWAKAVAIQSYTIVSGNVKGIGDYVVWICSVQTLDVSLRWYYRLHHIHLLSHVDKVDCHRGLQILATAIKHADHFSMFFRVDAW